MYGRQDSMGGWTRVESWNCDEYEHPTDDDTNIFISEREEQQKTANDKAEKF